jgi:hypothetical protein
MAQQAGMDVGSAEKSKQQRPTPKKPDPKNLESEELVSEKPVVSTPKNADSKELESEKLVSKTAVSTTKKPDSKKPGSETSAPRQPISENPEPEQPEPAKRKRGRPRKYLQVQPVQQVRQPRERTKRDPGGYREEMHREVSDCRGGLISSKYLNQLSAIHYILSESRLLFLHISQLINTDSSSLYFIFQDGPKKTRQIADDQLWIF